jgi:hypothetical protein
MATTKFKVLIEETFIKEHPEANEAAQSDECEHDMGSMECRGFGEVKTDIGWCPCILGLQFTPIYFYTEDDGWQRCPPFTFQEIK